MTGSVGAGGEGGTARRRPDGRTYTFSRTSGVSGALEVETFTAATPPTPLVSETSGPSLAPRCDSRPSGGRGWVHVPVRLRAPHGTQFLWQCFLFPSSAQGRRWCRERETPRWTPGVGTPHCPPFCPVEASAATRRQRREVEVLQECKGSTLGQGYVVVEW